MENQMYYVPPKAHPYSPTNFSAQAGAVIQQAPAMEMDVFPTKSTRGYPQ